MSAHDLLSKVKFRNTLKKDLTKQYDVVIIMCIHQQEGADMVRYYVKNLTKYAKSFACVIHYNSDAPLNENELPENFWICRRRISTNRYSRTLFQGYLECIKLALNHLNFVNILVLTSGTVLFRRLPESLREPLVAQLSHEPIFDPSCKILHQEPIPKILYGNITAYFRMRNHNPWLFPDTDRDFVLQERIIRRKFEWLKGAQVSGNVFPKEVGKWLVEDFNDSYYGIQYQIEELYFSTYAYNWAIINKKECLPSFTIIDWGKDYEVNTISLLKRAESMQGYGVCKVPYDLNNEVRVFVNKDDADHDDDHDDDKIILSTSTPTSIASSTTATSTTTSIDTL